MQTRLIPLVLRRMTLLVAAGAMLSGIPARAVTYTGSVSGFGNPSSGTVVTANNWNTSPGVTLSWTVTELSSGLWNYTYSFDRPASPAISHLIIELSRSVTQDDLKNVRIGAPGTNLTPTSNYEVKLYSPGDSGNSNPGLPGDIYGVKINRDGFDSTDPLVFSFDINRAPVWGDFYAKGGNNSTAWNTGFISGELANAPNANDLPGSGPSNGSLQGHILRPDSVPTVVPEPSTFALGLGALGLLGLAGLRRRPSA